MDFVSVFFFSLAGLQRAGIDEREQDANDSIKLRRR